MKHRPHCLPVATFTLAWLGIVAGLVGPVGADETRPRPVPEVMPFGEFGDGIVVDEEGQPVADAEVWGTWIYSRDQLLGEEHPPYLFQTKTDRLGMFSLQLRPDIGTQAVTILARDAQGNIGTAIQPNRSEPLRMMRIQLAPPQELSVLVVDEHGAACPGAEVYCGTMVATPFSVTTDAEGKATVPFIAVDFHNAELVARLPGKGLASVPNIRRPVEGKRPEEIRMTLTPVTTHQVQVVDQDEQPLAGAVVWVKNTRIVNTSARLGDTHLTKTNLDGIATVDLAGQQGDLGIYCAGHAHRNTYVTSSDLIDRETQQPIVPRFVLPKLVTIDLNLRNATGKKLPYVDLQVCLSTRWHSSYNLDRRRNELGPQQIQLPIDSHVALWIAYQEQHSAFHAFTITAESQPGPLELVLKAPHKLAGQVLAVADGQPLSRAKIEVRSSLLTSEEIPQLWREEALPGVSLPSFNRFRFPFEVTVDEEGRFSADAYPGVYQLHDISREEKVDVRIDDDAPDELTIWGADIPWGQVTGQVVLGKGIQKDQENRFQVFVQPHNTFRQLPREHWKNCRTFYAPAARVPQTALVWNSRGDLGGMATILPGERSVRLVAKRTVLVEGTIVGNGSHSIYCHLMADRGRGKWMPVDYKEVVPNKEGHMRIRSLIPGAQYWISRKRIITADESPAESSYVIALTAPQTGALDLGQIYLGQIGDTNAEAIDRLSHQTEAAFLSEKSLVVQIGLAKRNAEALHQNVLVIVGSPQDEATRALVAAAYDFAADDLSLRDALRRFQIVWVDSGRLTPEEQKRTGLPIADNPVLVIADPQGEQLAEINWQDLQTAGKLDASRWVSFLRPHFVEIPDGRKRYEDALKEANATGKRVLVTYGKAGESHLVSMAEFLKTNADALAQFCVVCSLDSSMPGAAEIAETLWRERRYDPSPWMMEVDPQGGKTPLACHAYPQVFAPIFGSTSVASLKDRHERLDGGDVLAIMSRSQIANYPTGPYPPVSTESDIFYEIEPAFPKCFGPREILPDIFGSPLSADELFGTPSDPNNPFGGSRNKDDPFGGSSDDPFGSP